MAQAERQPGGMCDGHAGERGLQRPERGVAAEGDGDRDQRGAVQGPSPCRECEPLLAGGEAVTPEEMAEIKRSSAEGYSYRGESGELPGLERAKDDVKALVSEVERLRGVVASRPKIVCICGSTRFAEQMNRAAERETLAGRIVVRPEVVSYSRESDPQRVAPEVKAALDELHKRKIDLADEVLVINVGGYVGDSTGGEIAYAQEHGKLIRWLETRAALEGKE